MIYQRCIKKFLIIVVLLLSIFTFSCGNNNSSSGNKGKKDNKYMLAEEEASFNFFWETQNTNTNLHGCGLIPDRYPSNGLASIASVGFGLGAFVVGAHNDYITFDEGKERTIMTLSNVKNLDRVNGFYYHFYQEKLGTVAQDSEVSNIDTAIFLCGALLAGKYFGEETLALAYVGRGTWKNERTVDLHRTEPCGEIRRGLCDRARGRRRDCF